MKPLTMQLCQRFIPLTQSIAMEIEIDDNFQRMHFLLEVWEINKQQDCSIRMVKTGQSCSKCKLVQMQLKTQKCQD